MWLFCTYNTGIPILFWKVKTETLRHLSRFNLKQFVFHFAALLAVCSDLASYGWVVFAVTSYFSKFLDILHSEVFLLWFCCSFKLDLLKAKKLSAFIVELSSGKAVYKLRLFSPVRDLLSLSILVITLPCDNEWTSVSYSEWVWLVPVLSRLFQRVCYLVSFLVLTFKWPKFAYAMARKRHP